MGSETITGTLSAGTMTQKSKKSVTFKEMKNRFVARMEAAADRMQTLMSDSQSVVSVQMVGMGTIHAQWLGSFTQQQPAITANAISQLNAVSSDNTLGFVKLGASLANSASPPTPGYQNLGTSGPGQGLGNPGNVINLPSKSTITTP